MRDMAFKTEPREHQKRALEVSRDAESYALVMEQGTGKTKVAIDTAQYLYSRGRISAMLILCPSGLQRNWVEKELDKHLPDHVPTKRYAWTRPPEAKKDQRGLERLMQPGSELRVLAMHYEAILTGRAKEFLRRFVSFHKVLLVADESQYIKNPEAKRTLLAWKIGWTADYRRILTGTPITKGPLDVYGQFRFLEGRQQGSIIPETRFTTFRAKYAETREITLEGKGKNGRDIKVQVVDKYKNTEELEAALAPYSFRVTKSECLDLPEKVYRTRDVQLTTEQRRIYGELLEEGIALVDPSPGQDPEEALWEAMVDPDTPAVVAQNALTLHMRLQQVLGGFVQPDSDEGPRPIGKKNPRLEILFDEFELYPVKTIVWARFKHEVYAILEEYRQRYGDDETYAVGYHGDLSHEERWHNASLFQEDDQCRMIVATPDTGARGIDLYQGRHTIFFSCSFNYEHRTQAEDRMHRHGFEGDSALYTDLVAPGTVDEKVIKELQRVGERAAGFRWGLQDHT